MDRREAQLFKSVATRVAPESLLYSAYALPLHICTLCLLSNPFFNGLFGLFWTSYVFFLAKLQEMASRAKTGGIARGDHLFRFPRAPATPKPCCRLLVSRTSQADLFFSDSSHFCFFICPYCRKFNSKFPSITTTLFATPEAF